MNSQFIALIIDRIRPKGCIRQEGEPFCIDQLNTLLTNAADALGYQFFRFSYRVKSSMIMPERSPGFHLTNFPPSWEARYAEQEVFRYDPMFRFTRDSESSEFVDHGYWSQLIDKALSNPLDLDGLGVNEYRRRALNVYSEAAQHGVHSGIYMHISTDDSVHQLNLASPYDTDKEVNWKELRAGTLLLGDVIKLAYGCPGCMNAGYDMLGGSSKLLSKAELEVLRLFYKHPNAGHRQIAELRNCTVDNIKMHLKNIRKKLGLERVSGHQLSNLVRNRYFI